MAERSRLAGAPAPSHIWEGAGGLPLAGDVWGDTSDPLVVLLHGGGQTRHAWKNTGLTLASHGFFVVAFDARGHGDSGWAPDGDYSQDAHVNDLVVLLEQLDRDFPMLVGASLGGVTNLIAVGEGHVDADALVLVDIAPRIEPAGTAKIEAFMDQRPDGFGSLDEVAEAIAAYQPHRGRPQELRGLAKNVRLGEDGRYRWHWDPLMRSHRPDPEERYERLQRAARGLELPTLLVRGALSDVLTDEGAREFRALCPHAVYVHVDGAAHMVAGDRNDAFADAVVKFLVSARAAR